MEWINLKKKKENGIYLEIKVKQTRGFLGKFLNWYSRGIDIKYGWCFNFLIFKKVIHSRPTDANKRTENMRRSAKSACNSLHDQKTKIQGMGWE